MLGGSIMPKIKIVGKNMLSGEIKVGGAKNSAVALVPASILCDETLELVNVPNISDIDSLEEILNFLNVDIKRDSHRLVINSNNMVNKDISCELSSKLRASYYFMGALLGKYKHVEMCFPGGCSIRYNTIFSSM